jgi:hypothetical protein
LKNERHLACRFFFVRFTPCCNLSIYTWRRKAVARSTTRGDRIMSRRLLQSFIVCLAFASNVASAVALNPRGIGGVLIYPYYTVNAGQDTLVTLVNTADTAKVARVRFLEGYNGRTVFATYVFLSAHDVWTAAITQVADDDGAKIATADASCTFPVLQAGTAPFTSDDYTGANDDTGPTSITRTREGSIEVIEVGDVVPGSAAEAAITHVQNGQPGGGVPPCTFAAPPAQPIDLTQLLPPTGGLYGSGAIVNVVQGTFFAYNATALVGFTDEVPVDDLTDATRPSLDQAHSSESPATARAYVAVDGVGTVAIDYDNGIDAVTAVLTSPSAANEFLTDPTLGANTDWVMTFPTKRFYVDEARYPQAPADPFVEAFHAPGQSRITLGRVAYDREELAADIQSCSGCGPAPPINYFAYEVNVFGFINGAVAGTPSGVFGSRLSWFYYPYGGTPRGDAGWATMDLYSGDGGHVLPTGTLSTGDAVTIDGLPLVGFMVYNVVNANAQPGVLGNYGGGFAHRSTLACADISGLPCPNANN